MSKFSVWNAAKSGDVEKLEKLVTAHPHLIDALKGGLTPMHAAAQEGHAHIVETLFRMGSQALDTPDKRGRTPMIMAASNGHTAVSETLVRLGSETLDTPDNNGWTPLSASSLSLDRKYLTYLSLGAKTQGFRSGGRIIVRPVGVSEQVRLDVRFRVHFAHSLVHRLLIVLERHQRISSTKRI